MRQPAAATTDDSGLCFAWSQRLARLGAPYVVPQQTTPIAEPYVVACNADVAALLDLPATVSTTPGFADMFAGNRLPAGAEPVAHRYAGHQFGVWAGQLGDGRAITLGGIHNRRGEYWEIQLKGAGQTPFSRFADGRAVLRSTVREYLVSEAMAGLGIPTTRALAIIGSDAPVYRETVETAAILTRVSPGLMRFGSFEWLFYANQIDALAPLADYVIAGHFPQANGLQAEEKYRAWVDAVIQRTAELIAAWQAVGFVHGVMNTDNMSVLGLTIDYGPFAFMEHFQPDWAPNHTDTTGRYAYDQQPRVALWNLHCFVQAVLPLLGDTPEQAVEFGEAALARYWPLYQAAWLRRMRAKLGLRAERDDDAALIDELFGVMARTGADFTCVFRALSGTGVGRDAPVAHFVDEFTDRAMAGAWLDNWRQRVAGEQGVDSDDLRYTCMQTANPRYVLRTQMAQYAIECAVQGDYSEIARLQHLLRTPFADQPHQAAYARPAAAGSAAVELSCSS